METGDELEGLTRAQLLERCQAAGLRATGWKKGRMAAELRQLGGPPPPGREPGAGEGPAGPADDEQEAAQRPDSPRRSGWCLTAPMWSREHLGCRARPEFGAGIPCACPCHAEAWARPPIPEGAQLSKYNLEDRLARGEITEAEAAELAAPGSRLADAQRLARGE